MLSLGSGFSDSFVSLRDITVPSFTLAMPSVYSSWSKLRCISSMKCLSQNLYDVIYHIISVCDLGSQSIRQFCRPSIHAPPALGDMQGRALPHLYILYPIHGEVVGTEMERVAHAPHSSIQLFIIPLLK